MFYSALASIGIESLFKGSGIDDNLRNIIIALDKVVQELNKLKNHNENNFMKSLDLAYKKMGF